MAPTSDEHGGVELNFGAALKAFVGPRRLGRVRVGEVGIITRRDPDRVRGADVLYISNQRWEARTPGRAYLDVAPELVVEVLSAENRASDMMQKLREYFALGVRLVWVADPATRTVLAYRSLTDVRELGAGDTLAGDDVLPGFAVPVAELFEI
jgi:Uma2 family endonuclease